MNSEKANPLCQLCRMVELVEYYLPSKEHAESMFQSLNGIIAHSASNLPVAIPKNLYVYDEVTGLIRQTRSAAYLVRDLKELLYVPQHE